MNNLGETDATMIPKHAIDTMMEKSGGFGRMQVLTMMFAFLVFQGTNFYIANLAYLELVPRLLCSQDGVDYHQCRYYHQMEYGGDPDYKSALCSGTQICSDIHYKVDYTDEYSFHNWIPDETLYCESSFMIGLFGSCFFAGFA